MWNRRANNTFASETHKWNTHVKHSHIHFSLGSFALLISGTYGLPFAYHMFVLYYIHSIYTYSHAAYHAMSSAGARRSCHCSCFALLFDLFLSRIWCITLRSYTYLLIYNVYNTALNIIWAHMIQNLCHTLCNKATSCIAFICICMCTYLCSVYMSARLWPDDRMPALECELANGREARRSGGRSGGRAIAYWLLPVPCCLLTPTTSCLLPLAHAQTMPQFV